MRVFITGIEGCIGTALAALHRKMGDVVDGCDVKANTLHHRIDIRKIDALREAMSYHGNSYDIVYHTAAMLGVQNTEMHPEICENINVDGTQNVVSVCEELGVPNLVFLSSSEIYGEGEPDEIFTELTQPKGTNVYALSKLAGESIVMRSSIPGRKVCRMFNCYGPWQVKQFLVPKLIDRAYRDEVMPIYANGDTVRTYLFSHDAAIFIRAVALSGEPGQVYNVGADERLSLRDVVKTFKIVSGRPTDHIFVDKDYEDRTVARDIVHRLGDFSKLKMVTEHVAHPFSVGLLGTIRLQNTLRDGWDYAYEVIGR